MAPKASTTFTPIRISSMADAVEAMEEFEAIADEIRDQMNRQVDLKKAVTEFAVKKKVDVIQIDGAYFRQVNRASRMWVGEPDDMPSPAPKGAKSLREICKGLTTPKGIPLWNAITKRVPDPEKIDKVVALGYVKESVISKAYIEKPHAPFLQRFQGEAREE